MWEYILKGVKFMKNSNYPLKKFSYEDLLKLDYNKRELINGRIYLMNILPVPLSIRIGLPIKGKRTMKNLRINYNTYVTK